MSALRRLIVAPARTLAGVDKIVCLGKQYLEHAKELGDPVPEKPVIFNKFGSIAHKLQPDKALDLSDVLPFDRGPVHYEAEICLQLGVAGSIQAVTLGLDLTLRSLQSQLKKDGHPWEIAKSFPGSAVIGPWVPVADFEDYLEHDFEFWLGDELRQKARGTEMRMPPEEAIQYIEGYFPLSEGDVVMTGTPAGVGAIEPGQIGELRWSDKIRCHIQF